MKTLLLILLCAAQARAFSVSGGGGVTASAPLLGDGSNGNPLRVDAASATLQGNTFNGVSQLVKTTGAGALPALSAANLTNIPGALEVAVSTTQAAADIAALYATKASTGNNGDILSLTAPTKIGSFTITSDSLRVTGSNFQVKGGSLSIGNLSPRAALDISALDGDENGFCLHSGGGGCNGVGGTPTATWMIRPSGGGGFQSFLGNDAGAAWYVVDKSFAAPRPFVMQLDRVGFFTSGAFPHASNFLEASPNNPTETQVAFVVDKSSNVGVGNRHPGTKLHMSSGTLTIDGNVDIAIAAKSTVTVGGLLRNGWERVSNTCGAATTCSVSCSAGNVVTGGGCDASGVNLTDSKPSTETSWTCDATLATTLIAYALCGRFGL